MESSGGSLVPSTDVLATRKCRSSGFLENFETKKIKFNQNNCKLVWGEFENYVTLQLDSLLPKCA